MTARMADALFGFDGKWPPRIAGSPAGEQEMCWARQAVPRDCSPSRTPGSKPLLARVVMANGRFIVLGDDSVDLRDIETHKPRTKGQTAWAF